MKPVLQVALDTVKLTEAVELASKIIAETGCSGIWIEAGTPLIKSWGRLAVKALKNLTRCTVVADTKSIDVPSLEASPLVEVGASVFTVLGLAEDEVVKEAVYFARERGVMVAADLISHPEPYRRALELARMGVDIIIYHIGVSVQKARGVTAEILLNEVKKIKQELPVKVAVAGGLKPGSIREAVKSGADILIVGGAITKSQNPPEVTKMILREIEESSSH